MTDIDNKIKIMNELTERDKKMKELMEFPELDRRRLSKISDKELALWQSTYSKDSPQAILADHEWNRRLSSDQIRATRFSAIIGLLGVILGFILGLFAPELKSIITPQKSTSQTVIKAEQYQQRQIGEPKPPSH